MRSAPLQNSLKPDGQSREGRTAAAVKAIDDYLAELVKEPMLKALQSGEAGRTADRRRDRGGAEPRCVPT